MRLMDLSMAIQGGCVMQYLLGGRKRAEEV